MTQDESTTEAVSLLQELGLQEYEARCFLALTRLTTGTAKDIHELSDVPRTRVYDAIRVLESQGLVEVQHSSPQRFRSVGIEEATETLRRKFEGRIDTLETHLEETETHEVGARDDQVHEVWSLTGHDAIGSRMLDLIEEADEEVALLIVDDSMLTGDLYDGLEAANERGVTVVVGAKSETIVDRLRAELPDIQIFETGIDWLLSDDATDEVAISRMLLVDRETLLIGSFYPGGRKQESEEQAVFAQGLGNGVVVLIRRLVASGLNASSDPAQ